MSHYTPTQFLALESEKFGLFAQTEDVLLDGLASQAATANNLLRCILVAEGAEQSALSLADARMHLARLDMEITNSQLAKLRELILAEEDVKTLHRLEPRFGRYCYLVETPFETFPKFVVGTTNASNTQVHIAHKCETLEQAEDAWKRLQTATPLAKTA